MAQRNRILRKYSYFFQTEPVPEKPVPQVTTPKVTGYEFEPLTQQDHSA